MLGGTGQKLQNATTVIAGVASLVATLMSIVSIWLQLKNYRKPLLQRYVVRILLMVPIYSVASWASMVSAIAAQCLDPFRDIYEAFTIYTFFQLLINYLGGERALIVMTHGREPVNHLWPMNRLLPPVDISDPHSFLAVKRGILQYAWIKPALGLAAIVMKATNTYQEGYIGLRSGYFWSGIVYNLSVTISLYSLGLFWVIMHEDLKPFRPVPKFLCVKLIIFASYWQGFFLSLLVWVGALPDDVQGYTPDNLAAAIQDALICIEMPGFAMAHWYAFSWHDFADRRISAARMPVKYALRDAFGVRDLIEDSKRTFRGDSYAYRDFDSNDNAVMAHQDSRSRMARLKAGMRYERGGKGKYWIASPDRANASEVDPYTPLLGGGNSAAGGGGGGGSSNYSGGPSRNNSQSQEGGEFGSLALDADMEFLYDKARQLEYGDWNYPVIPANTPSREERWRTSSPLSYQPVPSRVNASSPAVDSASSSNHSNSKSKIKNTTSSGRNNSGNGGVAHSQPEAVVVSKKKGKQKQHAASSSSAAVAGGPSKKKSARGTAAVAAAPPAAPSTTTSSKESAPHTEAVPASSTVDSATSEDDSARLWQQTGGQPDLLADQRSDAASRPTLSPTYDLGEDDDFRNVWGSNNQSNQI